jgi:16S rRNA processing protein RimM
MRFDDRPRSSAHSAAQDAAEPVEDARDSAMVRIGRITGLHGVRGALRFKPDNPQSNALDEVELVTLELSGARREYRLRSRAPAGHGMTKLELAGISDANTAEELKGAIVTVPVAKLAPTSDHEFYYFQVLGFEALLTTGASIGKVIEIFSNGANDVMVVRDENREVLVPVIEDVVKSIDLEARRVVIEPVPGLLD